MSLYVLRTAAELDLDSIWDCCAGLSSAPMWSLDG